MEAASTTVSSALHKVKDNTYAQKQKAAKIPGKEMQEVLPLLGKVATVGKDTGNGFDVFPINYATVATHEDKLRTLKQNLTNDKGVTPFGLATVSDADLESVLRDINRLEVIKLDRLIYDAIEWTDPAQVAHAYNNIPDVKDFVERQLVVAKAVASIQAAMVEVQVKGPMFNDATWSFYRSMKMADWGENDGSLPEILDKPAHMLNHATILDIRDDWSARMSATSSDVGWMDKLFTKTQGDIQVDRYNAKNMFKGIASDGTLRGRRVRSKYQPSYPFSGSKNTRQFYGTPGNWANSFFFGK